MSLLTDSLMELLNSVKSTIQMPQMIPAYTIGSSFINNCGGGCQGQCGNGCKGGCHGKCGNGCTNNCEDGCQMQCSTTCSGKCKGACARGCSGVGK